MTIKRPRILSPCVADRAHGPGERIVEVSFPGGAGGLISLRVLPDGRNLIELYRLDPSIIARLPTGTSAG